jgi:hypothetical protein
MRPRRRVRLLVLAFALGATVVGLAATHGAFDPPPFSGALTLGDVSIETVTPSVGGRLVVVRVPRGAGLQLRAQLLAAPGELGSLSDTASRLGAWAAINGDYHALEAPHLPTGPFVADGLAHTTERAPGYAASFWLTADGEPRIGPAPESTPPLLLGSGPRLLTDGELTPGLAAVALPGYVRRLARTAVGFNDDAVILAASTQDARGGLAHRDMAQALRELGCHQALALDGGPSTTLWVKTGWRRGVLANVPPDTGGAEPPLASGLFIVTTGGAEIH